MASPSGNRKIHGFLKRIFGDPNNSIIPLINSRYTIGRDTRCNIYLDDVNISRKHCVLNSSRDGWILTDCGGVNGTYLYNKKLRSATPTLLKDGLTIFLGDPAVSSIGFVFLKSLDKSGAASGISVSPKSVSQDIRKLTNKREASSPISDADNLKRLKILSSSFAASEHGLMFSAIDPIPGPSSFEDLISPEQERRFFGVLKGCARSTEPIPGPSCSGTQRPNHDGNVSRNLEPRPSASNAEEADNPHNVSLDGGSDSNCSISSLDSLKTRIRKKQKRESLNISQNNCGEEGLTKELSKVEMDDLCNRKELRYFKNVGFPKSKDKKDLQVDEVESTSTYQQDSDIEPSESLLPVQNPDEMCSQSKNAEMPNKKLEEAEASENEATITYLKERVLKLQNELLEANCNLTNINKDNRKQKIQIEVLESFQGLSKVQLMTILEDELCCNICTEILIKPVTLNCAHTFCKHCISVWKKKKKQCPMCREPIKTEMAILVLENLITKAVTHLEESYQIRRAELIQSRIEHKAEKKQKMRKRRARRSEIRSQRIPNDFIVTSPNNPVEQSLQLSGFGRIEMVPVSTLNPGPRNNLPYPSGIEIQLSDGSDSSVEGSGYYGGFGRCYNCGRRGHWSNGCPGL